MPGVNRFKNLEEDIMIYMTFIVNIMKRYLKFLLYLNLNYGYIYSNRIKQLSVLNISFIEFLTLLKKTKNKHKNIEKYNLQTTIRG